ncbi:MAG: glutamate--tRNA ligase [Actinobacteria bacterium]|nr:glutamate--tRNA ligase [Actinomycetota bacterium]
MEKTEKNTNEIISGPEAIRVRFAPSPTGYLHIGSARTAFFNWLFAKKTKGRFILRIEDTDISRHLEEAIELIMDSLKWLGMSWDEGPDIGGNYGPYRQSQRKEIYLEYAKKLVENGRAYYCFCSQEKLAEKRKAFMGDAKADYYEYDRECYYLGPGKVRENLEGGIPWTIRLLVPDDIEIKFEDLVYGSISVSSNTQEDFIIIRSNGLPTYNFSAAIDDILMEITHVIRGEDHLSNTPKQILVYRALNAGLPVFTHLPMILGADGTKLSKRHGSISIEAYRQDGFLAESIRNYLSLLGWSYDEKTTILSLNDILNKFDLSQINKRPARFDYEKLLWLNGHYLRNMPDKDLEKLILEKIRLDTKTFNANISDIDKKIKKIIPIIKERIKTLNEALDIIYVFFRPVSYQQDFIDYIKTNKDTAINVIDDAILLLSGIRDFSHDNIEAALRNISERKNLNFRKTAEIIRAAVWGSKVSPPMFGTMEIFGKEECALRLKAFKKIIA